MLAHRTTSSLIVLVHKTYSNANATFVYLPAVSYWKCSRAHVIVETSFFCHGRTEPVRPLPFFHPRPLGLGHNHVTVSASAYNVAGCLCSPPRFGGEIDYSPLRRCILIGIDCLAYAVPYSVNSRAAEVYLLTNRPCRRPLSYTSSLPTMMDSLCCSQVRRSGQSGTTQCTAAIN